MADTYKFTGKDGVQRTFVGDRPPTTEEMTSIEQGESGAPPASNGSGLTKLLGLLPDTMNNAASDVQTGVVKGAAHTAINLGQLVRMIPGVSTATDAIGNAVGGVAGRAMFGTTAAPVSGDAAFKDAEQRTAYTNTPQRIGGGLETLAEMMIPITAGAEAVPTVAKAGEKFQSVMGAAKNVPVDVNAPGDVALRIQQLADRGGSMPMAVRKFLARITDPSKGTFTYEEARDFASNISRLSVNEYQRMSPVTAREVATLRVALNQSVADAAQQAGKGAEYAAAMKEYAQAMKIKTAISAAVEGAKRTVPYASAAGAGYWLTSKIKGLLSGE